MKKTESQKETQKRKILEHLKSGQSITSWMCIQMFRCTVLAQRISDLKKEGWPIKSRRLQGIKGSPSEYWLEV